VNPPGASTDPTALRVLITDDQPLLRLGFRLFLDAEPDITVVGEAEDGQHAIAQAGALTPDVILMDVRMPRLNGIEATRQLTAAGVPGRILILTTFDLDEYAFEALRAGASGFLLKDVGPAVLADGIRAVARGDSVTAPRITRRLLEHFVDRAPRPASAQTARALGLLTPREREVLLLIGGGRTNSEIAEQLVLAETTVKTHVGRILQKLELRDRIQAVILTHELGLLQP
jgi:DNA-binding NarL/FixJ family response regulator